VSTEPVRLPPGNWNLPSEFRIGPVDRSSLGLVSRAILWFARRRGGGFDHNVFLTLARLGRLFPAHTILLGRLLGETRLSQAEKELVILRVAWRLGCTYEFTHHHHMALASGVPAAQVAAATSENADGLSERMKALAIAADELVRTHQLGPDGLASLQRHCTDDEVLELCMYVGHYVMVAMIIDTAGVQLEPQFPVDAQC
jgi:4-carboxymuconolactone decarboxylase